ncbi:DUF3868 domain-containing protein [Bacteroides cellulosilyticus]|uniref:DUF3868 domain-containing protein n=1 Tax=Bacteroides cellulosilyticus TaxID=246787 RepID=UPI00234D11AD|nr:DUF3868 domain-containing protein [Bacteroides cellulosilyticus]MDC7176295.1 DUF3868 domain-containing protein [Bacteroides cellulosilyticus]MDC7183367.1 DUF3868 domain-containing protein [Bacteroides cellulosilyticus]
MKPTIYILACLFATNTSVAQTQTATHDEGENSGKVIVRQQSVQRVDSFLLIDLTLDLTPLIVKSSRSVELTPLLSGGGHQDTLPAMLINGRTRHLLYQRLPAKKRNASYVVQRKGQTAQTMKYNVRIPYLPWMEQSELKLITDLCGCGWEVLQQSTEPVAQMDFREPEEPQLLVEYIAPKHEAVKTRQLAGSAFLDFPVNRTEIHPQYRNNPRELAKIQATIDSVRNNRFATITAVDIKGYASPEGSYSNNARLAQGRATALRNYVRGLYDFGNAEFSVSSEPEDWEGLRRMTETSDLPEKEQILAIIDGTDIFDGRERKLMEISGGDIYRFMLREWFPALRHSDYLVKYTIRNFTVEEAKELIYTDPRQLSLEEMYRVAQSYEPGTPEFNEVFEIAVRMYPDDPVSNLNAANAALQHKNLDAVRRYLPKAAPGKEKAMVEEALKQLEEFLKWNAKKNY